jgi:hypothetical protein
MVKTYQNLELFGPDLLQVLSILVASSTINQRGLRKSSSLTNGMGCSETKISLESMAKKARGLLSKIPTHHHFSMRPSWASADALSIVSRRRH